MTKKNESRIRQLVAKCKSAEVVKDPKDVTALMHERAQKGEIALEKDDKGRDYVVSSMPGTGLASTKDLDPFDIDSIRAMAETIGVEWEDEAFVDQTEKGPRARALAFWSSTAQVDRMGDIVEQDWRLDYFNKTGHILLGHDWGTWQNQVLARGIFSQVRMLNADGYQGEALYQVFLYPSRAIYEVAGRCYDLARLRLFNTVSVGFFIGVVTYIADPTEREQFGPGFGGYILSNNELLETSMVNIPANPGALQESLRAASLVVAGAASRGEIDSGHLDLFRETVRRSAPKDYAVGIDKRLASLRAAIFADDGQGAPITDPEQPVKGYEARLIQIDAELARSVKLAGSVLDTQERLAASVKSNGGRLTELERRIASVEGRQNAQTKQIAALAKGETEVGTGLAAIFGVTSVDKGDGPADSKTSDGGSPASDETQDGEMALARLLAAG